MNGVDVSSVINRQDISNLVRQMHRSSKELNRSLGQSVRFAAWAVADSLRTATLISDKYRKFKEDKKAGKSGAWKTWTVERVGKKRVKTFSIKARNKREAKQNPMVKIENRGLAQKAWHWAQSRLGSSRGGKKVSSTASAVATKNTAVTIQLKGNDPFVRIDNRLTYAADAFRTNGDQTVSNAMERAARRMMHVIDGQVAKKMGAK